MLLWEVSTLFVHLRWFLSKLHMDESMVYIVNGLAMILSFGVMRVLWGTYTAVLFWIDTDLDLAHPRPGGFTSGIVWMYRVCNWALMMLNYWCVRVEHVCVSCCCIV